MQRPAVATPMIADWMIGGTPAQQSRARRALGLSPAAGQPQLCAARLAADLVETQLRKYPGNRSLARLHVSRAVEKLDKVMATRSAPWQRRGDAHLVAYFMRAALLSAWGK